MWKDERSITKIPEREFGRVCSHIYIQGEVTGNSNRKSLLPSQPITSSSSSSSASSSSSSSNSSSSSSSYRPASLTNTHDTGSVAGQKRARPEKEELSSDSSSDNTSRGSRSPSYSKVPYTESPEVPGARLEQRPAPAPRMLHSQDFDSNGKLLKASLRRVRKATIRDIIKGSGEFLVSKERAQGMTIEKLREKVVEQGWQLEYAYKSLREVITQGDKRERDLQSKVHRQGVKIRECIHKAQVSEERWAASAYEREVEANKEVLRAESTVRIAQLREKEARAEIKELERQVEIERLQSIPPSQWGQPDIPQSPPVTPPPHRRRNPEQDGEPGASRDCDGQER